MGSMGVKVVEHPKGSGRLYLRICHNYQTKYVYAGPKNRKNITKANRKAAQIESLVAIEGSAVLNKIFDDSESPTLKQYINGWTDEKGKHRGWIEKTKKIRKYSTWKGYDNILKQRLIPKWGEKPLDKIEPSEIGDFVFELSEQKLAYSTIANIKNTLGAVLKQAKKDGYIRANPCHEIEIPRDRDKEEAEPKPFSLKERKALEDSFRKNHSRCYALVFTGFRTGLRIGELIGLQVTDLDFLNGVIEVQNNITRGRSTTPKSQTSKRKVRMTEELKKILREQIKAVKKESLKKKWESVPEWVFVNEEGNHINYGNFVPRVWNKAIKEAEISRRTPHDMRHTYATMRLSAGHPIHEVAKELGHSSPVITYKVYYKFIPDASVSNINELDKYPGKESVKNP
jgi:integrase